MEMYFEGLSGRLRGDMFNSLNQLFSTGSNFSHQMKSGNTWFSQLGKLLSVDRGQR